MVEEHEWPDIAPRMEGQEPPHGKSSNVAQTGLDHEFDSISHAGLPGLNATMDEMIGHGKVQE